MPEVFDTGTLSPNGPLAVLLGTLVARWSLAEATLIMPLMVAVKSKEQGALAAILASTNSAEGKIALTRAAVKNSDTNPDLKSQIDKSLVSFLQLCETRNKLFHHVWLVGSESKKNFTLDQRKSPENPNRIIERTKEDILELCNKVSTVAYQICKAADSNWITEDHLNYHLMIEISVHEYSSKEDES